MSYLFLSYAKADRESAFMLRDILEEAGFSVWMDKNQTAPRKKHWPAIAQNIREGGAFVLLLSDAAQKSDGLRRELDYAESLQKPIFPILIQGEAWARLKMPVTKLAFGLRFSLPIELLERLQAAMENAPRARMPQQIFISPIEQERPKRLKIYAILAGVAGLWLLGIFGSQYLKSSFAPVSGLDQTRTVMAETSAASVQTRRAEIMTSTAVSLSQTSEAIETYQAVMNLTATVGSGTLPCEAWTAIDKPGDYVQLSWSPNSFDGINMIFERQQLRLIEWLVVEDKSWYRIMTESGDGGLYVQGSDLVLDEDCPR